MQLEMSNRTRKLGHKRVEDSDFTSAVSPKSNIETDDRSIEDDLFGEGLQFVNDGRVSDDGSCCGGERSSVVQMEMQLGLLGHVFQDDHDDLFGELVRHKLDHMTVLPPAVNFPQALEAALRNAALMSGQKVVWRRLTTLEEQAVHCIGLDRRMFLDELGRAVHFRLPFWPVGPSDGRVVVVVLGGYPVCESPEMSRPTVGWRRQRACVRDHHGLSIHSCCSASICIQG